MGKKGSKTKATLDTNILISALGWGGSPKQVFDKIINGKIELLISDEQFNELSNALDYTKLQFTDDQKKRFKALILEIATFVEPIEKINVIKKDPADNMILECAIAGDVDYIVTGDSHLLDLKEFREINIVKAREFLEEIR